MESSLNSTLCGLSPPLPVPVPPNTSPSSSSSSSSKLVRPRTVLIPPNAALPPARENGEEATAVPNTLAFAGALKVPKSLMTFRGEVGEAGTLGNTGVTGVDLVAGREGIPEE